ncbi:MAG: hypothetical protein JF603_10965 [Acidobacteria bacterium]|nr:hypothetical protein [Acidobacteriota bacterium]
MTQRSVHHTRIVWAPPAVTRLKAVRSELDTLALIEAQRMLTAAEHNYHDHLIRREEELQEEALQEARQRTGTVAARY